MTVWFVVALIVLSLTLKVVGLDRENSLGSMTPQGLLLASSMSAMAFGLGIYQMMREARRSDTQVRWFRDCYSAKARWVRALLLGMTLGMISSAITWVASADVVRGLSQYAEGETMPVSVLVADVASVTSNRSLCRRTAALKFESQIESVCIQSVFSGNLYSGDFEVGQTRLVYIKRTWLGTTLQDVSPMQGSR